MSDNRNLGCAVVVFIVISFLVTGGMLLLLIARPLQSASGGCFINFGEGCDVYVTQTITRGPDTLGSPLFVIALGAVIFLGIGFLVATRGNKDSSIQH